VHHQCLVRNTDKKYDNKVIYGGGTHSAFISFFFIWLECCISDINRERINALSVALLVTNALLVALLVDRALLVALLVGGALQQIYTLLVGGALQQIYTLLVGGAL
jgi:hypothetical protein